MKRSFSLFLALLLCLSLFACGKQTEAPPVDDPPVTETPPAAEPAPDPVSPPQEEPVPADPLPGEKVEPEALQYKHNNVMFTFTDDKEEPLLVLVSSIPVYEGTPQINDYYQAIYDDLYAVCQLNLEDAARQKQELQSMGQEFTPWVVHLLPAVLRNDGVTLSVNRIVTEKRGEQETSYVYGETFDVATQGRLVLGDLFLPGADYLSRLPVVEPDQLNFAITSGMLMLCTEAETVSVPLSDLSDILKPQYLAE